jgi:hypothetical protein
MIVIVGCKQFNFKFNLKFKKSSQKDLFYALL